MADDEPDFIAILATMDPHKFIVAVMRWSRGDESHRLTRCSKPLSKVDAEGLAAMWAAATHLEVR